jgi:hypothetical protein
MFDDLRDLQPTEPGEGEDPFTKDPFADDELLSDLPSAEPDLTQPAVVADFDEPAAPRFGDEEVMAEPSRERVAMGMTAQQRAVLSVFLFLDVSVLGCVFLLALEKIAIP